MARILEEPLDIIRASLEEVVYVKVYNGRELTGRLHAYDHHSNMILGNVEELVTTIEIDDETFEEVVRQTLRRMPFLFIRGEGIILVATGTSLRNCS